MFNNNQIQIFTNKDYPKINQYSSKYGKEITDLKD